MRSKWKVVRHKPKTSASKSERWLRPLLHPSSLPKAIFKTSIINPQRKATSIQSVAIFWDGARLHQNRTREALLATWWWCGARRLIEAPESKFRGGFWSLLFFVPFDMKADSSGILWWCAKLCRALKHNQPSTSEEPTSLFLSYIPAYQRCYQNTIEGSLFQPKIILLLSLDSATCHAHIDADPIVSIVETVFQHL